MIDGALKASKKDDDIERALNSSATLRNDPSSLPTILILADVTNILAAQESALQAPKESSCTLFERPEPKRLSRRVIMEHQIASDDNTSSPSKRLEFHWLEYPRIQIKTSAELLLVRKPKRKKRVVPIVAVLATSL